MHDPNIMPKNVATERPNRLEHIPRRSKRAQRKLGDWHTGFLELGGANPAGPEASDVDVEPVPIDRSRHLAQLPLGPTNAELASQEQYGRSADADRRSIHRWRACPAPLSQPARSFGVRAAVSMTRGSSRGGLTLVASPGSHVVAVTTCCAVKSGRNSG